MLFTYQKSCEKLAKGEFMKIGLVKNTHPVFKRERNVSVCSEMRGLAATLPSTGIWHASQTIFSTQCYRSWEEKRNLFQTVIRLCL